MVEYRPECGIWCIKENNNHLRLKRQRLMKLFYGDYIQCEVSSKLASEGWQCVSDF